jgi:hypothetical protein
MKTRKKERCGEGDLNLHEIAPASTSIQFWTFRRASLCFP